MTRIFLMCQLVLAGRLHEQFMNWQKPRERRR